MKKSIVTFYLFLPLALALIAGTAATAEKSPPSICKMCDMKIEEQKRTFSVVVLEGIEPSAFDDLNCAMKWRNSECAMRQAAFDENAMVHDHSTGETAAVERAIYVDGSGVATPMASGIVAFKSRENAEAFIAQRGKGRILTYEDILSMSFK